MRILSLVVVLLCVAAAASAEDCTSLIEFEIEDQFKAKHTHEEFVGKPAVIVWSDRDSSKFVENWETPLRELFAPDIEAESIFFRPMAHVKGVPFFVKGKVRGKFSKEPESWVLLDWSGNFRKAYEPTEKQVTIFAFDADGCLVATISGVEEPDLAELGALVKKVRGL